MKTESALLVAAVALAVYGLLKMRQAAAQPSAPGARALAPAAPYNGVTLGQDALEKLYLWDSFRRGLGDANA